MSELGLTLSAAFAVLRRDMQNYFSYRVRMVTTFLGVAFSMTLFYYISRLVKVAPFADSDAYFSYAVIGLVILQMINATLGGAPQTLRGAITTGSFERMLVSAFGPVGSLASQLVFPVMNSMFIGLLSMLFGYFVFDLDVQWGTAALALPAAALAALAFTPFSVLLMAVTVLVKQAAGGATWIIAMISLVAGLYFPIALLPAGLRWASDLQPFTPAVELLRNVLVGTPIGGSAWTDVAKLAGFAAVLLPPSLLVLRWSIDFSRRRATILEF